MARRKARARRRRSPRAKARSRGGRMRRFARRARGVKLSIVSKTALAMAALTPVAIPGGLAASKMFADLKVGTESVSFFSKVGVGLATFANEFVVGFGLGAPFPTVPVTTDSGATSSMSLSTFTPKGAFLATTAAATGVVGADVLRSWMLNLVSRRGNRAARWGGFTLTSGK